METLLLMLIFCSNYVFIKCFLSLTVKTRSTFGFRFCLANDLSIENNRYISSSHCIFEYDNGHLYIRDTSSNGTLINRSRKITKVDPVSQRYEVKYVNR